jgi:hypothetical protein
MSNYAKIAIYSSLLVGFSCPLHLMISSAETPVIFATNSHELPGEPGM